MRQTGILAAAGLCALANNVERLAEDHANARIIGDRLRASPAFELDPATVPSGLASFAPLRSWTRKRMRARGPAM